jgi:type IV secretory pathway TraG/TraD family ATPase VirD4
MMLLLDEFINFGRIPNMAKKLTMIRHSHVGAVLGIQDYIQLDELYGDKRAKIIFGQPATRVFFKPNDFRTAEEISKLLGKKTAEDLTINSRCEVFSRRLERWLLTPQELMGLDETKLIARVPDLKYPLLVDRIPMDCIRMQTDTLPPDFPVHPVTDEHAGPLEIGGSWQQQANEQTRWWNSLKEPEKRALYEQEIRRKQKSAPPAAKPQINENPNPGQVGISAFPDLV